MIHTADGAVQNCSCCDKCRRTMIALEALGKLDDFSGVFDLEIYRRQSFWYKCSVVLSRNNRHHEYDNFNFAVKHGMKMPLPFTARLYYYSVSLFSNLSYKTKITVRRILGGRIYDAVKKKLKRSR